MNFALGLYASNVIHKQCVCCAESIYTHCLLNKIHLKTLDTHIVNTSMTQPRRFLLGWVMLVFTMCVSSVFKWILITPASYPGLFSCKEEISPGTRQQKHSLHHRYVVYSTMYACTKTSDKKLLASFPGLLPFSTVKWQRCVGLEMCTSSGTSRLPHTPPTSPAVNVLTSQWSQTYIHFVCNTILSNRYIKCSAVYLFISKKKKKGKWTGLYGYCLNARGFKHMLSNFSELCMLFQTEL